MFGIGIQEIAVVVMGVSLFAGLHLIPQLSLVSLIFDDRETLKSCTGVSLIFLGPGFYILTLGSTVAGVIMLLCGLFYLVGGPVLILLKSRKLNPTKSH